MPIRYLVLNDPHIDAKPPSSKRTDDYESACFTKLDHVLELAVAHECVAILCTGDWFHQKHGHRVPHRLVYKVLGWLEACRDARIYVASIAGNHDVPHGNTSTAVLRDQPYGVLMRQFMHLDDDVLTLYSRDDTEPGVVLVTGASYRAPVYDETGCPMENPAQWSSPPALVRPGNPVKRVHLVHASVLPTAPRWAPYTLAEDMLAQTSADVVHCGHIHEDLGILEFPNQRGVLATFTNTGSMTRGSLTEETVARVPNVLLAEYDFSRCPVASFTRLPLPCAPATEIYDVTAYRDEKIKTAQLSQWGDQLRRELAETTEGEEEALPALIARTESLDSPARRLALGILDTL